MQGRSKVLHLINPMSRVQMDIANSNNNMYGLVGDKFCKCQYISMAIVEGQERLLGSKKTEKD